MVEKRILMRVLTLCANYEAHPEEYEGMFFLTAVISFALSCYSSFRRPAYAHKAGSLLSRN